MDDDIRIRIEEALSDLATLEGGSPDLAGAPSLSGWRVIRQGDFAFLTGTVEGRHPRIPDGRLARTSILVALSSNRTWARTLSRYYRLLQCAED